MKMNRKKFMEELEVLLFTIPQVEREEALHYYSNYFDDAGEENEEEVLKELGTPEKVAKIIFDEIGQVQNENVIDSTNTNGNTNGNTNTNIENQSSHGKMNKGRKILMIATSIIWAPILFSFWVVMISLLFTMGILTFTFAIVALVCVVVGFAAIIEGFIHMFLFPAYGLCVVGSGFVTIAIGILFLLSTIFFVTVVIPALHKLFVLSYTLPFQSKEEK